MCGNLFSACFTDKTSVGASTSVFGIFTGQLAMILLNWQAFDVDPQVKLLRTLLLFFVFLMLILNFQMTNNDD